MDKKVTLTEQQRKTICIALDMLKQSINRKSKTEAIPGLATVIRAEVANIDKLKGEIE